MNLTFEELLEMYKKITFPVLPLHFSEPATPDNAHIPRHLAHVRWMLDNMPNRHSEAEKFQRWFGFVQAILWQFSVFTIDQLRLQTECAARATETEKGDSNAAV